jgi:Rrf2 family transcriptional regulator, cysteine metabolism repressor
MKISTKGKYGIKAMLDLALQHGEGSTPLKDISERQHISEPYLEQIIAAFKKDGLVSSIRGVQGGYQLAKLPNEISIAEIIIALEGPLLPFDGSDCAATVEDTVLEAVWDRTRETVNTLLDNIMLADLVSDVRALREKNSPMYYI